MSLMALGLILIFIGILILIWPYADKGRIGQNNLECAEEDDRCIGPIPIVVGSDPKAAILLMLIALVIMLVCTIGLRLW